MYLAIVDLLFMIVWRVLSRCCSILSTTMMRGKVRNRRVFIDADSYAPTQFPDASDLALAQFNTASRKLRHLRQRTGSHGLGEIIFLNEGPAELDTLLAETGDTWLVLYFDEAVLEANARDKAAFRALQGAWAIIARELADVANVAVCDLRGNFTTQPSLQARVELDRLDVERDPQAIRWTEVNSDTMYVVDSHHQYLALPCAKLHRGVTAAQQRESFAPDIAGRLFGGSLRDAAGIVTVVRTAMTEALLESASVASTPTFLRRAYAESLSNFRCGAIPQCLRKYKNNVRRSTVYTGAL
jgi:hypothetical protein